MLKPLALFLLIFLPGVLLAQQPDTLVRKADSIQVPIPVKPKMQYSFTDILAENKLLNSSGKPVSVYQVARKAENRDGIFYLLAAIVLMLGILKAANNRYFNNLVRVFFNTSLRQSQLTDQLLQAKLPSLFYNLFFVLISGLYVFLVLHYYGKLDLHNWLALLLCILAILVIYIMKFIVLQFAGWLTGYQKETDTYIFIVFLINKILAICLVPMVIVIAFSGIGIVKVTLVVSFALIGMMMAMRFFRSYGLLQSSLKVSRLHFILYIIGIELLPLLLIYKGAVVFMIKNL